MCDSFQNYDPTPSTSTPPMPPQAAACRRTPFWLLQVWVFLQAARMGGGGAGACPTSYHYLPHPRSSRTPKMQQQFRRRGDVPAPVGLLVFCVAANALTLHCSTEGAVFGNQLGKKIHSCNPYARGLQRYHPTKRMHITLASVNKNKEQDQEQIKAVAATRALLDQRHHCPIWCTM